MAGSHEVRGSIPLGSTKFSRFDICRTFFISSRFDSPPPYLQSRPKRENTRSQIQSATRPDRTKGSLVNRGRLCPVAKRSARMSLRIKHHPEALPKKFSK